jgi:tetratricopeptide (TPR) repeat protein
VRATALSLLAGYPGEAAGVALRSALLDDEDLLRQTAVQNLSVADPAERVSLLAPLLFDPVKAVRVAAVSQLAGTDEGLFEPYQLDAYREALAEYVSTMEYSLDFAFAGANLGTFEAKFGRAAAAESYFKRAIAVDDLYFPAKINLAILLSGQGRNREAEQLLREVVAAYPANHEAAYLLGLLLVEMEKGEEAARWIRQAAAASPRNARVWYNLGLLEQSIGRDAEAEAALRAALALGPDQPEYLFALADHYVKRDRLAEALALVERLIEARPDLEIGPQMKAYIEAERERAGER